MKLTIITAGRNDDYCGNFKQRLEKNINRLCANIQKLNLSDVQIVISDWCSPENEKLSDVLNLDNKKLVNFLYIPPSIGFDVAPFSVPHAWNAAFRRTISEYVMFLEADTYIPLDSFKRLIEVINDANFNYSWGSRYQIPYDVHLNCESYSDLDKIISDWFNISNVKTYNEKGWSLCGGWVHNKINNHDFGGGGTSLLIKRDIYESCRGMYEVLTKWGWNDIELHRRICSRYNVDNDLEDLGIIQFTQEHYKYTWGGEIHGQNPNSCSPTYEANTPSWGLFDNDIKIY